MIDYVVKITSRFRGAGSGAILARGSLVVLLVRSSAAVLGFVMHLALARALGIRDYGFFVYAMSWVIILGMISRLGMDNGLTRLVAQYRVQEQWGALAGVLRWAMRNTLAASLVVSAVAATLAWLARESVSGTQIVTLWIALIVLPVMSLGIVRQGALRGLRLVGKADIPESVLRPILVITALLTAWWFGYTVSAPTAMWLVFVSYVAAFLLGTWWVLQDLPDPVKVARPEFRASEWWKISIPLLFIQGMQVVLARIDVIMLGTLAGPDSTGIYGAVSQVAAMVLFGLQVVNPIAAPMISELYHTGKREELQKLMTLAARISTAVTLLAIVFLAGFGEWVMSLFGGEFIAGYAALMILLLGQLVNGLSGSVGYVMTMTGHQNQSALILGVAALLNIVLNWLLIPLYGMEGAAAATAISIVTWNISMLVYVRVKIGIRSTVI